MSAIVWRRLLREFAEYEPEEMVNKTPFPHEDGAPRFRRRGDGACRTGPYGIR
jgi:hypothetical protein